MNCEDVAILLDEYVDGELADADSRLVEAHLAGCELCAEACEALQRELAVYASYERPVEAGDAMWASIRERIEPGTGSTNLVRGVFGTRRWMAPLVAAACLAIVGSAAFVAWRQQTTPAGQIATGPIETPSDNGSTTQAPGEPTKQVHTPVPQPPAKQVVDTGSRKPSVQPRRATHEPAALPIPVAEAEKRYVAAIALLRTEIDRTSKLDPASRESSRKSFTDLDENIQTARHAVEQNPNDPIAVNSMLSAYDEKVETMQRLVALQARNDR